MQVKKNVSYEEMQLVINFSTGRERNNRRVLGKDERNE